MNTSNIIPEHYGQVRDIDAFTRDIAAEMYMASSPEAVDLETVAAKHGVSLETTLALVAERESAINQQVAELNIDGKGVGLQAQKTLGSALHQLAGEVEAGNLSHGMLLRAVEVLNKIVETRKEPEPEREKFTLIIHFGDRIDSATGRPRPPIVFGDPIEGEAVEVRDE